jgi:two-component system, LytTR family, sensor kinase
MLRLDLNKSNNFYNNPLSFSKDQKSEKRKTGMSRSNAYWLCQLTGWSIFTLVNIVVVASFEVLNYKRTLIWFFLFVLGIGLTHLFRSIIKKHDWTSLTLKKIIPRVILSSLIIGSVMYASAFSANIIFNIFEIEKFNWVTPLVGVFNLSSVILLWALIYFSVHYFENYKKAEIESLIWEAAVKDFELKTLKSQLNPHFMFNALNSIRALIEEDPASAKTAITKLSNILRYSLKIERNETVPLEDEIQTVADYLALESVRFEERLKYMINIEPGSSRIEIPPMMIQTLVENGIKHGISKRTEGGKIWINSKIINSNLKIEIKNSGRIDHEALRHSQGFGISNTKHRLSLLYGEKAAFTISNESEGNVIAELVIPIGGTNR